MSNFTDFFPTAAGNTDITDPDRIPKVTAGSSSTAYLGEMFHTIRENGATNDDSDGSISPYFGSNTTYANYGGGKVSQTTDNTEITLANVTSGSGYLCCIVTPIGGLASTQEIKITIDGGTEKVYTFDYSSDANFDGYYTRLIFGFSVWGSPDGYNTAIDSTATGILGMGGAPITFGNSAYPPLISPYSGTANLRLFTALEFKNYGLPKLRFDSSLLVKCKTNGIYSTSGEEAMGTAVYYLDSQL